MIKTDYVTHQNLFILKATKTYGLMTLFALFIIYGTQVKFNFHSPERIEQIELHKILSLITLVCLIIFATFALFEQTSEAFRWHKKMLAKNLGPIGLSTLLYVSMLAAIGEELLFRMAFQWHFGIFMTSLFTCFLSMSPHWKFTSWSFLGFFKNFLLGYTYLYTECIHITIIIQFILNLAYFLNHFFTYSEDNENIHNKVF